MTKHKTDMNITKIDKYKKTECNFITEHKTDMNVTEKLGNIFTTKHKIEYNYALAEQHFYDGTQNRI